VDRAATTAFLFVWGLLMGSFLTVVAHRVPRGESVVGGRSHCPACGAQIAAYDNAPVVSWLLLRGRARCCGAPISPRYPLTELATGVLYAVVAFVLWDDVGQVVLGLAFVTMLVAITLTDLAQRIIPNKVLLVGTIVGLILVVATDPGSLPERAIATAAAGRLLFAIALAYPRGMGLGDVKLTAVMGLYLGRSVAPALLIAFAAGGLFGLALIALRGAAARKQAVPFGPFLALGGVVGLFAGEQLVDWYLGAF
jgi:leader peptidase (prepilin peptidase) / N-methyltransferase